MAEEAVSDMPLDNIEWYHEKYILDYFAEVGLFLKHGLDVFAEITLRQLIALRCDSPDIGPDHHETWHLQKYLEQALRSQEKIEEADELKLKIEEFGMSPYVFLTNSLLIECSSCFNFFAMCNTHILCSSLI
jgi:hypothetical protein